MITEEAIQPKFAVGEYVRVKMGTADPDYPETPLGGWVGTVSDIQEGASVTYRIQWTRETLQQVDPACRERCKWDDLAFEVMSLAEDDLERDYGMPLRMEQAVMEAVHSDWAFIDDDSASF